MLVKYLAGRPSSSCWFQRGIPEMRLGEGKKIQRIEKQMMNIQKRGEWECELRGRGVKVA